MSAHTAHKSSSLSYFIEYLPRHHNEKSGIYYWPVFGPTSRSLGNRKSIYAKYFDANRLGRYVTRDGRFIERPVSTSWVNFIELFPPRHMRLNIHASIRASQLNVQNSVNTTPLGNNGKLKWYYWYLCKGKADLTHPVSNEIYHSFLSPSRHSS